MVRKSDKEGPRIETKCKKFIEGTRRGYLVKECKVGGAGVKLRSSSGGALKEALYKRIFS